MKKRYISLYSAVAVLAVAGGSGYYAWSMHRRTNASTAASTAPLVHSGQPRWKAGACIRLGGKSPIRGVRSVLHANR